MKLKELNRELERIDELSLTSIKNKSNKFINKVIAVASGELVMNEVNEYREISIFKNGVTL